MRFIIMRIAISIMEMAIAHRILLINREEGILFQLLRVIRSGMHPIKKKISPIQKKNIFFLR